MSKYKLLQLNNFIHWTKPHNLTYKQQKTGPRHIIKLHSILLYISIMCVAGDYLGEKNDFNEQVLKAFVDLHDFTNLILVQALR